MQRCLTDEEIDLLVQVPSSDGDAVVLGARAHLDECRACQDLVALLAPTRGSIGSGTSTTLLDRFRVIRELGRGGMGVVYMVWDPKLRRALAIKLLHSTDAMAEQRMQREAQALARLAHPNIVTVFDVGTANHGVYMTMELVQGASLRVWAASAERARREIVDVYLQAGEGLFVAHRAGVVHRDFKPDNVLVGDDGRVRIVDFGLAHADVVPERSIAAAQDTGIMSLTRSGWVVGTPAYMAPEQHRGQAADARSDQFAFCVSFWEALYGVRPFVGETARAILQSIERGEVAGRDKAKDALANVVLRGLAVNPRDRHSSMADLLRDIRAASSERRRRVAAGAVAIATGMTVLAASVAAIVLVPRSDASSATAAVGTRRFEPALRAAERAPSVELGVNAAGVGDSHAAGTVPLTASAPVRLVGFRTAPGVASAAPAAALPSAAAPATAPARPVGADTQPPRLGANGAPLIQ